MTFSSLFCNSLPSKSYAWKRSQVVPVQESKIMRRNFLLQVYVSTSAKWNIFVSSKIDFLNLIFASSLYLSITLFRIVNSRYFRNWYIRLSCNSSASFRPIHLSHSPLQLLIKQILHQLQPESLSIFENPSIYSNRNNSQRNWSEKTLV